MQYGLNIFINNNIYYKIISNATIISNIHDTLNYSVHRGGKSGERLNPDSLMHQLSRIQSGVIAYLFRCVNVPAEERIRSARNNYAEKRIRGFVPSPRGKRYIRGFVPVVYIILV